MTMTPIRAQAPSAVAAVRAEAAASDEFAYTEKHLFLLEQVFLPICSENKGENMRISQ